MFYYVPLQNMLIVEDVYSSHCMYELHIYFFIFFNKFVHLDKKKRALTLIFRINLEPSV